MAKRKKEYWCHPQKRGHPALYFHGHQLISRAAYIDAVGPDDCDPHVSHGRRTKRAKRHARQAH
jgi:hypothetical protein